MDEKKLEEVTGGVEFDQGKSIVKNTAYLSQFLARNCKYCAKLGRCDYQSKAEQIHAANRLVCDELVPR